MNKLYIDQITRYMSTAKFQIKNCYEDQAMAHGSLQWFVAYLEKQLKNCHGVEESTCYFYWKHEDCNRLMALLADLTGDDKYTIKPMKGNSWD
jgi:hypothetical protein